MSGGWTSHQADGRQVSREKVTRTFLTMSGLGAVSWREYGDTGSSLGAHATEKNVLC